MESILVVEDDDVLLDSIVELLKDDHYFAVPATTAEQAIAEANRTSFHLVLSDVRLAGGVDGVGVIEAVQAIQPHIRSIIMTGYADMEVPLRAARVRADDYLHKPFNLAELVDSIRSVLSRDRAPFRTKFSRLTCSPIQSARDYMRTQCDSQWLELNLVRELCLKRYFLLVRSRRLGVSQGYALFCQLEQLELEYFESSERAQWIDLNRRYQELESQFTGPSNPSISSDTLTRELFQQLYAKILDGAIESVHLQRAIPLLHFPEVRRQNVESHSTYHWIWCSPNKQAEDLAGLRVEGHKLLRQRGALNLEARLYETDSGHAVLCLADSEEAQKLLREEVESGRAELLKPAVGHHFLLYRGERASLHRQLPPEGLEPRRAWALMKPVFHQVYLMHKAGKCSGSFSFQEIQKLPGDTPRIRELDPAGFTAYHESVQSGQAISLAQYCAPEAFHQAQPCPRSDQAILGRLMIEVILGFQAHRIFSPVYYHCIGEAHATSAWENLSPRLGSLGPCLYRLCQRLPEKRYSDLREAASEIERAFQRD